LGLDPVLALLFLAHLRPCAQGCNIRPTNCWKISSVYGYQNQCWWPYQRK